MIYSRKRKRIKLLTIGTSVWMVMPAKGKLFELHYLAEEWTFRYFFPRISLVTLGMIFSWIATTTFILCWARRQRNHFVCFVVLIMA